MKTINFIQPWQTEQNKEAYGMAVYAAMSYFEYEKARKLLADIGYRLPVSTYESICQLVEASLSANKRKPPTEVL